MNAGDEGIATFDAVNQFILAQEIERAVNGNRRRPPALACQHVDDFIGAERLVTAQQRLQDLAADRA